MAKIFTLLLNRYCHGDVFGRTIPFARTKRSFYQDQWLKFRFGLLQTGYQSTKVLNITNATSFYIGRMRIGTNRAAFHIGATGTLPGGQMLFGDQRSAQIYYDGDLVIDPDLTSGAIKNITIANGGTNYIVGGVHNIVGGTGVGGKVLITAVNNGVVTGVAIYDVGKNYTVQNNLATQQIDGGQGGDNNLTINILGMFHKVIV